MNPEEFKVVLNQAGISLTSKQAEQFQLYYQELVAANQKVNLTRITEENEVYLKHFYDSLTPALAFPELFGGKKSLVDVGAGAGFPSLPLKLIFPQLRLTIIDSLAKRLDFLQALLPKLALSQVKLVHLRAEAAGQDKKLRERFDLVTARAVAQLPILAEYCLPLLKVGGSLLALKGPNITDELTQARNALKILGGEVQATKALSLPDAGGARTLVLISKVAPTPKKYPRQAGTPKRRPL